ncbi:hypothetical protein [Sinorhizobium medicae]|uniref:hypothetical protein n=1 Tax=Sinorhizobium medicae TaxID=110321 RepID=UPI001F1F0606|nr:hypothetical protein [Sinorhizobium medicae]
MLIETLYPIVWFGRLHSRADGEETVVLNVVDVALLACYGACAVGRQVRRADRGEEPALEAGARFVWSLVSREVKLADSILEVGPRSFP